MDGLGPSPVSKGVRQLTLVQALLLATNLVATSPIDLNPKQLTMSPGESTHLTATYHISGLLWPPLDWYTHYAFVSDAPDVLDVRATMIPAQGISQTITVTALRPGVAGIHLGLAGGPLLATVTVPCGEFAIASTVMPIVTTHPNQPVTLHVASSLEHPLFDWFAGLSGDNRNPLSAFGPTFTFTPITAGTQYVWARIQGQCTYTTVQFRIDSLAVSRPRPSRH